MNSIGIITWWLVPSRHAVLSFSTTSPARLFKPLPVLGRATYPGMQAEAVGVGAERRGFTTSRRSARGELQ